MHDYEVLLEGIEGTLEALGGEVGVGCLEVGSQQQRMVAVLNVLYQVLRRLQRLNVAKLLDQDLLQCLLDDVLVVKWCLKEARRAVTGKERNILLGELGDVVFEMDVLTVALV
jgi:hypothetical protein